MRKGSDRSSRPNQILTFLLDNIFDIITITTASALIIRYSISSPDQENVSELLTSILAVLGLIAISGIWERNRRMSRLEITVEKILKRQSFFITDFRAVQDEIDERIENSKDLLIIGNNLEGFFKSDRYSLFEKKLQRKTGSVRVVLAKPGSPACDMAASREYRPVEDNEWRAQVLGTLNLLEKLKDSIPGQLSIRVTDTYLTHGILLSDYSTGNGAAYCWMYRFKNPYGNRPKFVLRPTDTYWYDYYAKEAEAIWDTSSEWKP